METTKKNVLGRSEVQARLAWTLDMKIEWAARKYAEYMIEYDGHCYNAFSGGKDSRTTKDIIEKIHDGTFKHLLPPHVWKKVSQYPIPPDVFCNTGLEYPEIVAYVKSFSGVVILKPIMGFTRVIKEYGVAIGSKKVAGTIVRLKKYLANPSPKNAATRTLYLTGIKKDGQKSKSSKLPNMWHKLLDAPFKVSDKCCDIFKKEPFKRYVKETGRKAIVSTTVEESNRRMVSYMQTGCNSFEQGKEKCRPISIFTDGNIWEYAHRFQLQHCEVYYDRTVAVEQLDGTFKVQNLKAESCTGCTFCLFGIHLEDKKQNNRIQRLAISHPKYYHIVIEKCGLGEVLEWLGISYKPYSNLACAKQSELTL